MSTPATGRCGRSSSARAAASPTCTSARLHAPDAEMALRNARDLYTRRSEGVSIWVVPAGRDHRVAARTRRTRSSTRPATRSTGTRRSTTSPKAWSTCDCVTAGTPTTCSASADDALVSAQRLGWWIAARPSSRRTSRSANIALDQLGQARTLLTYAGRLEGDGRGEDDLAYLRDEREFRNVQLVERPQTATSASPWPGCWSSRPTRPSSTPPCSAATDETLAGVAGKAVKEVAYHRDHATPVGRCGSATAPTSRTPACRPALDAEWPYVEELFEPVDPAARRGRHRGRPDGVPRRRPRAASPTVLDEATLAVPEVTRRHRRRSARAAHRGLRLPAGRDAAPGPLAPGGPW